MFAKLVVVLLGLGLTSGALLVNRQHRIDAAVEIGRAGERLRRQEASLGLLRAEVAKAVRPDLIAAALDGLSVEEGVEGWKAIPGRFDLVPLRPLAQAEATR